MSHDSNANGRLTAGLIVLGVGVFFLLKELEIIPGLQIMWPVFPIIVGIALIVSAFHGRRRTDRSA